VPMGSSVVCGKFVGITIVDKVGDIVGGAAVFSVGFPVVTVGEVVGDKLSPGIVS